MPALLFIPWFKLEAWIVPVMPVGLILAGLIMFGAPQLDALAAKLGAPRNLVSRHGILAVLVGYAIGHGTSLLFSHDGWQLPIQPFGILVATGVLTGARVAEWRAAKQGLRRELIADHITHVVFIGFILGHMFDAVLYTPELLREDPRYLFKPWAGLSSFGGFFGAAIGAFVWRWRRKVPLMPFFDQVAFGMPLGWMFGRMGCFVVHDHPGRVTDFFLAVDNYPYAGVTAPRHDLGLYEVFWSIAMMLLFLFLNRKPRPNGFFLGTLAVLYAPFRFGLDFLREADETYAGFTPGHYSAALTLALGLWVLWRAYKLPAPEIPEHARAEPEAAAA